MAHLELKIRDSVNVSDARAEIRTRYTFTAQFLVGAAIQTRLAREIEARPPSGVGDFEKMEHRSFVVGAIMQAVASLESEIWEVVTYGPGHHLGSNGIDQSAKTFLEPLCETLEKVSVLKKYEIVLHLLNKANLPRGEEPWQSADLTVRLRNEIVHYKSKWGPELDRANVFQALKNLNHPSPAFAGVNVNFFPHECLSSACAGWAVAACANFLNAFYLRLGIRSPIEPFADRIFPRGGP